MDGINLADARPYVQNKHSNFDLSFKRKFDGKFGDLIPSLVLPVMPSDKIDLSADVLMRMAPFVQQVFQDYKVCLSFYYVPNRVLWHNFEKFLTGGFDGSAEYVHPYLDLSTYADFYQSGYYGLFDYMDVPGDLFQAASQGSKSVPHINALPFFAYCRVIIDYFMPAASTALTKLREEYAYEQLCRDGDMSHDFIDLFLKLQSYNPNADMSMLTPGAAYAFELPQCLYPLDYFTSARTSPQNGPAMTIPVRLVNTDSDGTQTFRLINNSSSDATTNMMATRYANSKQIEFRPDGNVSNRVVVNGSVFENVATINDFYSAARVQELFAVYGYSGYSSADKVAAEFGVSNPNRSLQRAQLLYHDTLDVAIGEVFSSDVNVGQTENPVTDIPGSGTAIGKLNGSSRGFSFDVPEHGFIIGLTYCYPEASYQEGLPRIYRQLDRFDYPHPLFSELSMQSIKMSEVCTSLGILDFDFAYTSRYGDYKVGVNRVNGNLKDNLSSMVAGRKFRPNTFQNVYFNDMFLHVVPQYNNLNRTFNVVSDYPTDHPLFFDLAYKINAYRPLPYYGLPKF